MKVLRGWMKTTGSGNRNGRRVINKQTHDDANGESMVREETELKECDDG